MSYLAHWLPLRDEDAHTALVFGFLRHAPSPVALDVWLSQTLGRSVTATPLERDSFWPNLASVVPGSTATVPELVIEANDGLPLTVVIEVKPGYDMHTIDQISREVIDVTNAVRPQRIACVMVGADLGRPASTEEWEAIVASGVNSHVTTEVEIELHYSAFADLGRVISACGRERPEWNRYAADVNAQLARKGLLGYEGAPMFDDLEGLTVPNAVEVFNRTIKATRQFYLQLHSQSSFMTLGLKPHDWNYRMLRDGRSDVPTQEEAWFATTIVLSLYKSESEEDEALRAFVAFDLLGAGTSDADLLVGRVSFTNPDGLGPYRFAEAVRAAERIEDDAPWTERGAHAGGEWLFDREPWRPSQPDDDIEWVISRLTNALV